MSHKSEDQLMVRINVTLPLATARELRRRVPEKQRSKLIAGLLEKHFEEEKNMDQSFWKPGSIVTLNEPYKPGDGRRIGAFANLTTYADYHGFPGFTHGIIAQCYAHDKDGVSHVSLHLYNAEWGILYIEDFAHGIPTYVDFHVSEVTPLKDGAEIGYKPIEVV